MEGIRKGPLAASPLLRPLIRLAGGFNALVRDGHFQGVALELKHRDNPYFLLSVAPDKPPFYVELFLGNLDGPLFAADPLLSEELLGNDPEALFREEPLCVLMNWMGVDTEPAFWETDISQPGGASLDPALVEEPDFEEVFSLILAMTEAGPVTD